MITQVHGISSDETSDTSIVIKKCYKTKCFYLHTRVGGQLGHLSNVGLEF